MADITNPEVVRWSNERLRTIADQVVRLKYVIDAFTADYTEQDIEGFLAANSSEDRVVDGSLQDGRPPVTRLDIVNGALAVAALQALLAANVGSTGKSAFDILNSVQVNGSPRS
jgi:hypothetical protein